MSQAIAGAATVNEGVRRVRVSDCLQEVTAGVGSSWKNYRVLGATRDGLAPAKEAVGKQPERYKLVEPGSIFYNPMRILIGSIAFLDEGQEAGVTSPDYVVFKSRPGIIHPRWLYYWLRSDLGAAFIKTLARGAVRERMLFRRFAAAEFFLPPYEAQLEFASQVLPVERACAAAEVQLEAAKALPAAYFRAVFNSPETQKWPSKRVRDLCQRIDYGFSASADFTVTEPRFLRITDIQNGNVDWEKVPGCQISSSEEAANKLADEDIVFARTGATTGKSFLIRRPPRAVFASYLIRLRPSGEIAADYLYAFFQSDSYWKQIRASARGGAQPNVNASLLGAIIVPTPYIAEQERVVAILQRQMTAVERTSKGLEAQLATIHKLPATLLRRAFGGEL